MPRDDRAVLFRETAARMGVAAVIVEKDFWVCWALHRMANLEEGRNLLFKGGTSLSKAFRLIERFSEDVDLAYDRTGFGFEGERDPLQIQGTNARKRAVEELARACRSQIMDVLVPALRSSFSSIAGEDGWDVELAADDPDQQTLLFRYPVTLDKRDYAGLGYIVPSVRLALGARSDHEPSEEVAIRPYAAEEFPREFIQESCGVKTLAAERTFWEKATILHAENHRPGTPAGRAWQRASRHCYDLAMMIRGGRGETSLGRIDLLEQVVAHKKAFFPRGWANYDAATPGTLALVPSGSFGAGLARDYAGMDPMIFGEPPTWESILDDLRDFEHRVNS
jgi:hypothetical protein